MKKTIVLMLFLLILVFTFTSCKSDVSNNDSLTNITSDVYVDANGSSANKVEEHSSIISNVVEDWNNDSVSIEITSSESVELNEDTSLIDSSNSKDTVTNKPQYENSSNTVLNESQTEDSNNTISVISVPEYYEGRY